MGAIQLCKEGWIRGERWIRSNIVLGALVKNEVSKDRASTHLQFWYTYLVHAHLDSSESGGYVGGASRYQLCEMKQ